jgi:hypothetical protein
LKCSYLFMPWTELPLARAQPSNPDASRASGFIFPAQKRCQRLLFWC